MNAIIALCHFCNEHGPRTLFCTQTFKYDDSSSSSSSSFSSSSSSSNEFDKKESIFSTDIEHNIDLNEPNDDSTNLKSTKTTKDFCKACQAFDAVQSLHQYISYENNKSNESQKSLEDKNLSNICYVSQAAPNDCDVFALVRKACLRTLHCEIYDEPIYFDDDEDGSVIGYEFRVKDKDARGRQRLYSLLIIMKDRIYLQHLWSFLSKEIAKIANNIKNAVDKQFEIEKPTKNEDQLVNKSSSLNFKLVQALNCEYIFNFLFN
jgi:folliculin